MLFVKLREVCGFHKRKVVGQPSDNLTGIPHPDEVSYVLELEAAVSRPLSEHRIFLKIEPFPGPVDLNVAFRVKRADAGGRALEVASVDGSSEFVFVAELDVVHVGHPISACRARLVSASSFAIRKSTSAWQGNGEHQHTRSLPLSGSNQSFS